ncbi:MAG: SDR family oxidoreductase [Thermoleophilia bacterium]|nr:SDR family oxidoreductase [Thermoleophilia bacterium]
MALDGKVAVVTGGGSGLGEAIALRLSKAGARVAVLEIDLDAARLTADLAGGVAVRCDVSDSSSVDGAAAEVERELGPIDVWVNNAGVAAAAQAQRIADAAERQLAEAAAGAVATPLDALVRLPDDEWRTMLAVHLDGTFYGTRAAARSMARRGGAIVNIASVCGVEGCVGYPHYSAAKAGVIGFTRSVAKELAVQRIRVNAVAPGFLETAGAGIEENSLRIAQRLRTPLGRFGRKEEIAATVEFLASDDAGFFIGETLNVNGGLVTT